MNSLKNYIKRITPDFVLLCYKKLRRLVQVSKTYFLESTYVRKISSYYIHKRYKKIIYNKKNKEQINVVFFALFKSVWKYD